MKSEWTIQIVAGDDPRTLAQQLRAVWQMLPPEVQPKQINVVQTGLGEMFCELLKEQGLPAVLAVTITKRF